MKRKPTKSSGALIVPASKPRNPLVASAVLRKAGAHRKTNKALRAESKNHFRRVAQLAEQGTFNLKVVSSRLTAPTISDLCAGL